MEKIRTVLRGSWGTEVTYQEHTIKFDETGTAEVDSQVAKELVTNFPDTYYREGEAEPVVGQPYVAPPVDVDFRTKFEQGTVAEKTNPAQPIETEEQMRLRIREELMAEMAAENAAKTEDVTKATTDVDAKKEADVKTEANASDDSKSQEGGNDSVRKELDLLNTAELKDVLKSAKVAKKDYEAIEDKAQLIELIIAKEIL